MHEALPEQTHYKEIEAFFQQSIATNAQFLFEKELFTSKLRELSAQYGGVPCEVSCAHHCCIICGRHRSNVE